MEMREKVCLKKISLVNDIFIEKVCFTIQICSFNLMKYTLKEGISWAETILLEIPVGSFH